MSTLLFTFQEPTEGVRFLSMLKNDFVREQEMVFADVPLKKLCVEEKSEEDTFGRPGRDVLHDFGWKRLRVINKDPDDPDSVHSQTVGSDHLRVCAEGSFGTVTDRVNLGT